MKSSIPKFVIVNVASGKTVGSITERELCLVVALRTRHRFGEVTLQMKDGVVMRIEEVHSFDPLDDEVDLTSLS